MFVLLRGEDWKRILKRLALENRENDQNFQFPPTEKLLAFNNPQFLTIIIFL